MILGWQTHWDFFGHNLSERTNEAINTGALIASAVLATFIITVIIYGLIEGRKK